MSDVQEETQDSDSEKINNESDNHEHTENNEIIDKPTGADEDNGIGEMIINVGEIEQARKIQKLYL